MTHDLFGQTTTLSSEAALRDWNAAQLGFLAHSAATPTHLGAVLEQAPEFALGHAVKGLFTLLLGRRELYPAAHTAAAAARQACAEGSVSRRERAFVDALDAWLGGRPSAAAAILQQVLTDHPDDTLAMKLEHAIRFVLGDAPTMRASIEQVLPAYAPDHPGRGYLLGCQAFALEETGEYAAAEAAGRQALWLAQDDAWGLHAVAHVYDMTGDMARGIDWLEGREAAWQHCNNFRYHVWWHKALMHLDLGQIDAALALYDTEIRSDRTDDYRDISNATSLLMRLELEGVAVGDRWEELAEFSARRTEDGCLIFADLHYLLALTGDGRREDSARLLARIRRDSATPADEAAERMAHPGEPAAQGLEAFAEGRFDVAFARLSAARGGMQLAGGSHAQRDVFERLTIDAGLRAGEIAAAERVLDERQARRAGREDGYTAARRQIIAKAREIDDLARVPAQ